MRKAFAGFVCAVVLLGQAYAVVERTDWYWPFLDYPMYSGAWYPGDRFRLTELRLVPCQEDRSSRPVDWMELRGGMFAYYELAEVAAGTRYGRRVSPERRVRARERLNRLIRTHIDGEHCSAEVWARTYTIGREGLVETQVPWKRVAEWELPAPHGEQGATRPEAGGDG